MKKKIMGVILAAMMVSMMGMSALAAPSKRIDSVVTETAKAGQGTITATFDSLSPVAFVVDKNTAASSSTSPKTGESMAVTMAAVVVVVAAAGAFAFRKKESVR